MADLDRERNASLRDIAHKLEGIRKLLAGLAPAIERMSAPVKLVELGPPERAETAGGCPVCAALANLPREAQLGYATSGQLLDELRVRMELDGTLGYSTMAEPAELGPPERATIPGFGPIPQPPTDFDG